jgi:hypothetical protein
MKIEVLRTIEKRPREAQGRGAMEFKRIPNEKLEKADVPDATAPWPEIELFGLTFNGYEAFPGDECANLANKVMDEFSKNAKILEKLTLTELRACLFFEQRRYRHCDEVPDASGMIYIGALLNFIRTSACLSQTERDSRLA